MCALCVIVTVFMMIVYSCMPDTNSGGGRISEAEILSFPFILATRTTFLSQYMVTFVADTYVCTCESGGEKYIRALFQKTTAKAVDGCAVCWFWMKIIIYTHSFPLNLASRSSFSRNAHTLKQAQTHARTHTRTRVFTQSYRHVLQSYMYACTCSNLSCPHLPNPKQLVQATPHVNITRNRAGRVLVHRYENGCRFPSFARVRLSM